MSEFSDINNARIALLERKRAVGLTHFEEQLLERLTETVDRSFSHYLNWMRIWFG